MTRNLTEAHSASLRILRPIARWLLKCGIGVRGATRLMQIAYAQAGRDLAKDAGKASSAASRIASLTSLKRQKVKELLEEADSATTLTRHSAQQGVQRVLWGWHHDRPFQNPDGTPRLLPRQGPRSFHELVRRHSGDRQSGSCLKELLQAGAVRERRDGLLQVTRRSFATAKLDAAGIEEFGEAIGEHVETLLFNLDAKPDKARYTRRVTADRISPEYLELLASRLAERASLFCEHAEEELNSPPHVMTKISDDSPPARLHVSVSFWFDEPTSPTSSTDSTTPRRSRKKK